MSQSLAIIEVVGLTPALVALDAAEKAAPIRVWQMELNDFYGVVFKVSGGSAELRAAVAAAEAVCAAWQTKCTTAIIDRPDTEALKAIASPAEISPLLEAPVVFFPNYENFLTTDQPATPSSTRNKVMADSQPFAIGMIETQGFTAVLEAIDTACKAANVEVIGKEKLGGGYITVLVRGDVAAVKAAIDSGKARVEGLGKLIAAHVIPRPSSSVLALLPKA